MIWDAMQEKKIPTVDIYTGGMARLISQVYDKVQYSASRLRTGETLVDIPQTEIPRRDGLFTAPFFKTPITMRVAEPMLRH